MKRILLPVAALAILAACGGKSGQVVTPEPLSPAAELRLRLDSVVDAGKYLFGHHDDTAYGHTWEYEEGGSDVKAVTGEYPALMSWDLGLIEVDSARNLDGVPFGFIRSQIAAQHARGGFNTISWHPINPATRGNSWDTSVAPLADSVMLDTLTVWIDRAAAFIASLKDADGKPLPVIFRPWHENSGSWFWWGSGSATPEQYIALYRLTRERFDSAGIDNVLWAYSPDKDLTHEQYLSTYPGDDYVDILGTDIYAFDGEEGIGQYTERVRAQLPMVVDEARRRGKIAAFTETGLEGLPVADWYTRVLRPLTDSLGIAYVCVWRNGIQTQKPEHFYVPYPGHPSEADFRLYHDTSNALFVK